MINTEHKDRVFKFIFGSPDNRQWTLSLYNALKGSSYDNPDDIQFNTIEDAVYLGMKNDVSFIIMNEMHLWEHQSSYNPNMPMRFFIYAAKLYEKYISGSEYYQYSRTLQTAPCPKCICFYNGRENQPEEKVLRLSDAFNSEGDIEVRVTMLNINYGKNKALMKSCEALNEYAWLVDSIRKNQSITGSIEDAVETAIAEMPDNFVIRKFLLLNKAEVKGMFLTEWDQAKVLEQERKDSVKLTTMQVNERVARDMLIENYPLSAIEKISQLSESTIRKIAETLGITVFS